MKFDNFEVGEEKNLHKMGKAIGPKEKELF